MKILALSGSLRAASINSALLRAAARLAPAGMDIVVFRQLGELPLFNPDLESKLPAQIAIFYQQIAAADALIIASPEYAHGISGALKNALDWLVSFEPFVSKRIAVFNASSRAYHANTALHEVLKTMSAVIVEPASITIPLLSSGLTEQGMVDDADIAESIVGALVALYNEVIGEQAAENAIFPVI